MAQPDPAESAPRLAAARAAVTQAQAGAGRARSARPADRPPSWRRLAATLALMAAAAIWGATYLVVKRAVTQMPVFDFLAWRFCAAAALLIAARPGAVRRLGAGGLRRGILLGLALGAGYITQAIGLRHTPAAVSGFLTGLFVVFTPVLSWLLLRRRLAVSVWLAVLVAGAGLALITAGGFAVSAGEFLSLTCAVFFALQIVGAGEWSPGRDPYALTVTELATAAVMCLAGALASGRVGAPHSGGEWLAVAITAVLASALGYTVQMWAQTWLTATQTAVILTLEPVFAAIFAVAVGGERLGAAAMAGGVLVVTAMYLVQVRSLPEPR